MSGKEVVVAPYSIGITGPTWFVVGMTIVYVFVALAALLALVMVVLQMTSWALRKSPVFKAYANAAQTLGNQTTPGSAIAFQIVAENVGGFNVDVTNSIITIPKSGNYILSYLAGSTPTGTQAVMSWISRTSTVAQESVVTHLLGASVAAIIASGGAYAQQLLKIDTPIYFSRNDTISINSVVMAASGTGQIGGGSPAGTYPTFTGSTQNVLTSLSIVWLNSGGQVASTPSGVQINTVNQAQSGNIGIVAAPSAQDAVAPQAQQAAPAAADPAPADAAPAEADTGASAEQDAGATDASSAPAAASKAAGAETPSRSIGSRLSSLFRKNKKGTNGAPSTPGQAPPASRVARAH